MFSNYINFDCDSVECGNFQSLNEASLHNINFTFGQKTVQQLLI